MRSQAAYKTKKVEESGSRLRLYDFLMLTKPTITLLVVVTVLPTLLLDQPAPPSLWLCLSTLLGTALLSGSAAVFNQLVEKDIDLSMYRTRQRGLPSGKVSTEYATAFGLVIGVIGFALLYQMGHPNAAWIALGGHFFYVGIYTLFLKKRTAQNIVIGGAAGSVGPLIGWAASHDGALAWPAWVLFLVVFLWTPPHFWALALKYQEDYKRANIPMYPVIYGEEKTRQAIFLYSLSLLPCIGALLWGQVGSWIFIGITTLSTLNFVVQAYSLYRKPRLELEAAMKLFFFSCVYLFLVFGSLFVDRLVL